MKLLKPAWVQHEGKPVFSIDIHPDGSRFATGGQGENSGIIIIWNFAPVRDENSEKDDNVPKRLCQMDNHLGCVNCVRWSNNGRYLASGGDDKLVMIWQAGRYGGTSTVFGSDGQFTNVEQWRVANVLRGHSEDVLDLAWSPHDAWLATCSVDNTVIVWNALKFPEQLAVLRGHSGLVKGVTWDPVGKYLASQSDDKSLRVWRTSDWAQEACVEKPFEECGGTTHVLRLNWSPDGHYIVSAHAMNNSGPTAQIVERDGWKDTLDFVGHRKAITCVRFNPNILRKRIKKNSEKNQQYTCCAIGSRDRSVSVWLTALKRPLVVTHDLFKNSVLDVSWSVNGMELLCCSADGTVAYLGFSQEEIGKPITKEEKIELHRKIYGKSLTCNPDQHTSNMIIESSALLKIQQQKQEEERKKKLAEVNNMRNNTPRKASLNSNSMSLQTPTKQIETRTKDGKRRITPIFLSFQPDIGEAPQPFSVQAQPMFSSSKEQSVIVREKVDSQSPGFNQSVMNTTPTSQAVFTSPPPPSSDSKVKATTPSGAASQTTHNTPSASASEKTLQSSSGERPHKDKDSNKLKMSVKRKLEDSPTSHSGGPSKRKDGATRGRPRKGPNMPHTITPRGGQQLMVPPPPVQTSVIEKETRIVYTNSGLNLSVPEVERSSSIQVTKKSDSEETLSIEVENYASSGTATIHRLRAVKGLNMLWQNVLPSPVLSFMANSNVVCAACKDQSVNLHSTGSGRKLLPSLMLDSKVHKIRTSGYYVMAITSRGSVYVWNIQSCEAVIKAESLLSIIPDDSVRIDRCMLTEHGLPVLTLNTGISYTYKLQLGCWVMLHNKNDVFHLCSDHQSCVPRPEAQLTGTLATLQSNKVKGGSSASRLYKVNSNLQQSSTLSYLENQVTSSLAIQSHTEYHFWFMTYVRYLVQEGLESRLREVCDDLLGPVIKSKSISWLPSVLGHNKRSLLQEVLPIVGANLNFQRLYAEYQEQLDSTVK